MKQLLLATHNAHKLEELRRILENLAPDLPDVEVVGLSDIGPYDPPKETGASFIDNAVIKARSAASQCDLITIADDSGITIDALNGMPGILSARWAGKHGDDQANLDLVLAQLTDIPDDRLGAAFVCAAALVVPGTNRGKVAEERMLGHLVREPRGENGFGYDPIFVALGETLTNAELEPERKDQISHRAKALRALVPYIKTALGDQPDAPPAEVAEAPPAPATAPGPPPTPGPQSGPPAGPGTPAAATPGPSTAPAGPPTAPGAPPAVARPAPTPPPANSGPAAAPPAAAPPAAAPPAAAPPATAPVIPPADAASTTGPVRPS
jgi:XTP/dITP diphosphohydrolase